MSKQRLKVGVIGCGYWGKNIIRCLSENPYYELTHCCDIKEEALKKISRLYPWLILTKDESDILENPSIDAVFIVTPVNTHYSFVKASLEHGKHVFVEKPLTDSYARGYELVELAKTKKKILMVGHIFEYVPAVRKIKELIKTNRIGKIYYISSKRVNLGIHRKDVSVIWDLAPHDFSMIFYWLEEEPKSISCFAKGCIIPDKPDIAFINLQFPSGIIANIETVSYTHLTLPTKA